MAQDNFAITDSLDKAGLLSKREKEELLKDIKQEKEQRKKYTADDRVSFEEPDWDFYPLQVLTRAKMHATAGVNYGPFGFMAARAKIEKGQEKNVIQTLSVFAKRVWAAKLISEKTYTETIEKIKRLELRSEFEVASFMTDRSEVEFYLQPKWYKKFIDRLLEKELITAATHDTVMQKSAAGELRNYEDVYPYLKNFLLIDLRTMPSDPAAFLEAVHRRASGVLPELHFDSFKLKIVQNKRESFDDFVTYDAQVTLTKNGKRFVHKSFFKADYKNKKSDDDRYPIDIQSFHQVFNKMLVDEGVEYRLHIVKVDSFRFGLLPLTKKQFENLVWYYTGQHKGGYINVSYENFSRKITQKNLLDAIKIYDATGLLERCSSAQKDSAVREAQASEVNYYSDVLSQFPNLVFEIDLEYGINKGQYKELTKQLASISRGHFKPVNIVDGYDYAKRKQPFDYGFTLNGKTYRTKLKQDDDWLDPGFWELIQQAVAAQDKSGQFYDLYPSDGMRCVYLTYEQYRILKEKKLLEFEAVGED